MKTPSTLRQIVLCMTLALFAVASAGVAKENNPGVVPPQAKFRGKSYGEWHAQWWQWADSFKNSQSPVTNEGGPVGTAGQTGNVWFLAGYFGDWFDPEKPAVFTREITIPSGTALFFPILNGEVTPMEWKVNWAMTNYPEEYAYFADLPAWQALPAFEEAQGVDIPEPDADDLWELLQSWFTPDDGLIEAMSASVDGKPITNLGAYRAPMREPYTTWLPAEDNHMEDYYPDGGEVFPVVCDGWCLLLAPLPVGEHIVKFKASFGGTLGMDITYIVTVKPGKK